MEVVQLSRGHSKAAVRFGALKAAELVLPRQFAIILVDEQCITRLAPRDDTVGIPESRHTFVWTH